MITPYDITELQPNDIFVFGSNRAGNHIGGAARTALEQFGAVQGIGEGLVGQSYAFPTLNRDMFKCSEDDLVRSVVVFRTTAEALPSVTFYLTKVGCGIAGFTEDYMKQFFKNTPSNVIKPAGW